MESIQSFVVFAQKLGELRHKNPELEGHHGTSSVLVHVLVVLKVQVGAVKVAERLRLDFGHGKLSQLDQERDSCEPNLKTQETLKQHNQFSILGKRLT